MLKFLTHKLRTHSLNEENFNEKTDEDHDSGTESDEEINSQISAMSSPGGDPHSSEEELEVINTPREPRARQPAPSSQLPEKRKWSASVSPSPSPRPDSASSDDDELGALPQFRASPPLEALKPGPPAATRTPPAIVRDDVSPRKRSRSSRRHQQPHHQQRPCLDFEKMQQLKARSVTAWRHSGEHGGELSVFCW